MVYDFTLFKKASDSALEWLKKEYSGVRTGRATPNLLDSITVDAYGGKSPINQVATVTLDGPKSLRIIPWDKSLSKAIDSAIRESNLGVSVSLDDAGLRVSFPELTSERRTLLIKIVKEKFEEARIALRSEREKVSSDVDRKEKEGAISEDEKFRLKAELQKLVDEANKRLEALAEGKESEIKE
ncbi:MAG: ribosome recycling factor [bacterium]|nr:ribosome recycling factor [bacterium]